MIREQIFVQNASSVQNHRCVKLVLRHACCTISIGVFQEIVLGIELSQQLSLNIKIKTNKIWRLSPWHTVLT